MKAIVCFHGSGAGAAWWSRWCRDGFKHCFLCLDDGRYWIKIDGSLGAVQLRVVTGSDFDLAGHYRAHQLTVIETETRDGPPFWPLVLATCVGLIKRVLVIRRPWVLTPRQLHRYLTTRKES